MGSPRTAKRKRQRLRQRLRQQAVPATRINELLPTRDSQRPEPLAGPSGLTGQAYLDHLQAETYARLSPPDGSHRPRPPDPITTGAARATGQTAAAVKRGKTVTRWEHQRKEAS